MALDQEVTLVNKYFEKIIDFGFEYIPKLIGGLIVLLIGLWITKLITKAVGKSLVKSNIDLFHFSKV
jgi:small conductance mechanosensitive channel